jgi:hypothetical protein
MHAIGRRAAAGKESASVLRMTIGQQLREARQHVGLSREQIAHSTKVPLPRIEALEQNAFESLPPGVSLDDLVRDYACEVGLDPEPLVRSVHAEHVAVPDEWKVFTEEIDTFPREGHEPTLVVEHDFVDDIIERVRAGQAAVVPAVMSPHADTLRSRGRLVHLALLAFALIAAAGWGAYVYERTRLSPTADSKSGSAMAQDLDIASTGASGAARVGRATAASGTTDAMQTSRTTDEIGESNVSDAIVTGVAGAAEAADATPQNKNALPRGGAHFTPEGRAEPTLSARRASSAPATSVSPTAASSVDVSGSWALAADIEIGSDATSQAARLGYVLDLQQVGNRITGTGRKVTENGQAVDESDQVTLKVAGGIARDRLTLTFTEHSINHIGYGRYVLILQNDGTLLGRFASDVPRVGGTVAAARQRN